MEQLAENLGLDILNNDLARLPLLHVVIEHDGKHLIPGR